MAADGIKRQPAHWGPSLAVIIGFLPVVGTLGGWALNNSNKVAVIESTVADLRGDQRDDEHRIEKLEIQVASLSGRCK